MVKHDKDSSLPHHIQIHCIHQLSAVSVFKTNLQINPTRCTILLSIFISLLYMFRTTMCPSSGEITVSMRHWYLSLCMGGFWSAGWSFTPTKQNCAPSWIYLQDCSISFLPEITLGVLRDAKQKGGKYLNICC